MNIIIMIVLCILILYLAIWLFSKSSTLSNYQTSTIPLNIPSTKISTPNSLNYSYSVWIYINAWQNTVKPKALFYRSSAGPTGKMNYYPSVSLGGGDNTLTVSIQTESTTNFTCQMSNIPLQTWTNVTISLNNKVLDMYMNGKLVKTCIATALPKIDPLGSITLCPAETTDFTTWNGKVARFSYYPKMLGAQEAWNIYKAGPSGNILSSFLSDYKIRLSFLRGGEEKANITI